MNGQTVAIRRGGLSPGPECDGVGGVFALGEVAGYGMKHERLDVIVEKDGSLKTNIESH